MRFTRRCCNTCVTQNSVTGSWGSNSTTIGHGATEQNGNWEILSGNLRVTTADAIITWDAGVNDWSFYIPHNIPATSGPLSTDYSSSIRAIFNFVDNNNFDFAAIRKLGSNYMCSFGERVAGVETILHPVAGGGGAISKQFSFTGFVFVYKDEIIRASDNWAGTYNPCAGGSLDSEYRARTWYRPRVNNIIGIGTDPTWSGNLDIGSPFLITTPAPSPCSGASTNCWYPTKPTLGCTNHTVAKTLTVTIAGTPYTCYPSESNIFAEYYWSGSGVTVVVSSGLDSNFIPSVQGDIHVLKSGDQWLLSNSGSARSDCDAWTSLNIPPVAPNVQTCTITGNY